MPDTLPFSVSLDRAFVGAAVSPASYSDALAQADKVLAGLAKARSTGGLELLTIADREDDLAEAESEVQIFLQKARTIFVLGTGGSSLGGQAISNLLPFGQSQNVHFLDNLDPQTLTEAFGAFEPGSCCFVAISKSGGTAETMVQVLTAADMLTRAGLALKDRFLIITEPKPSPLRRFGESIACPILPHPEGIGGRYSVLSIVGLLPAMLMGLDAWAIRAGAKAVVDQALSGARVQDVPCAAGAALHFAMSKGGQLRETILWSYADRLKTFGPWWRQLWAESLGKGGQGSTPVAALGPVDQHSQLQLFLDGPGGALFTIVSTGQAGEGPKVPRVMAENLGVGYLGGRSAGDLSAAEARATAETLARRGRPVRDIHVARIDERAIGALFMHFMLETIVMGELMGIDPFDQPAVEEGKVLAKAYLEGKTA